MYVKNELNVVPISYFYHIFQFNDFKPIFCCCCCCPIDAIAISIIYGALYKNTKCEIKIEEIKQKVRDSTNGAIVSER